MEEQTAGIESHPSRTRYAVVGYHDHDFGLAVAGRNSIDALEASGRSVELVRLDPWRNPRNRRLTPYAGPTVNLFHANPNEIGALARQWLHAVDLAAPHVAVPYWELPVLPRSWELVLARMDAVLAPTRFIGEACRAALPGVPIVDYPQAPFLPEGIAPSREAWGLPRDATVFVVAFGLGSDIDRKNPGTAIEAFRRAFPVDDGVRLVVKTRPWPGLAGADRRMSELTARVAGDRRIRVIDGALPFEEQLGLYASCDVLLSTHRSEGLGLHLMESMSMGKVVAATGWSGNVDFMTPANSVALSYQLVPVVTHHEAYSAERSRAGQVWAEADLEDTVRALRELRANPEWRLGLGARAARDMEARRRSMRSGESFDRLEDVLSRAHGRRGGLVSAVARGWIRSQVAWVASLMSGPRTGS
ncbi:MAG: glycosyltransferase family 4 protein [Anaeromyxobacteraceae bacterium]